MNGIYQNDSSATVTTVDGSKYEVRVSIVFILVEDHGRLPIFRV